MATHPLDRLRWLWPTLIIAFAAILRFVVLNTPATLVFDELYYVRDAISQLAHGYATSWPDSEPGMADGRATAFGDDASYVAHPPLGKWLIGLGIFAFGPDNGWGWRSAVALAGVATVGVTMRLGWLMTRSLAIACLAGLFLAVDGVHIVLSRVALLDGLLTFAVILGALFFWLDRQRVIRSAIAARFRRNGSRAPRATGQVFWARPWLLAAAVAFGGAAAIKWSGLFAFAAFLLLTIVHDAVLRRRLGVPHVALGSAVQAAVTGLIALPAALVTYIASWSGWIFTSGGWGRDSGDGWPAALLQYHIGILQWHASLTAEHPYQSHPLTWPLGLNPTAMYIAETDAGGACAWANGCISGITPIPNPVVTWGGVIALVALAAFFGWALWERKKAHPAVVPAAFILTGYLSGWLPWLLLPSRSAVFQFYTVVLTPFAALATAIALGFILQKVGARTLAPSELGARRAVVALIAGAAVAIGLWFFPLWSGVTVASWFWDLHLWLPDW